MEQKQQKKSDKKKSKHASKKSSKHRKRSRSRSNSLEKESQGATKEIGWKMVVDTSTQNPVIEIDQSFEFVGTVKFRVMSGSVEVFDREFDLRSPWTTVISDPKKDLIYPLVKMGEQ